MQLTHAKFLQRNNWKSLFRLMLGAGTTVVFLLASFASVWATCNPEMSARPIYQLNPGPVAGCESCLQDYDVDVHEYESLIGVNSYNLAKAIIGDDCFEGGECHGWDVRQFYQMMGGNPDVYSNNGYGFPGFMDLIAGEIADNTSLQNSVVSLSISGMGNLDPVAYEAFTSGYDDGALWVAAHSNAFFPCSSAEMDVLGGRVMGVNVLDQSGSLAQDAKHQKVQDPHWFNTPNSCMVTAATSWNGRISCPGSTAPYENFGNGHGASGSYTTPLVASVAAIVSGIVANRDGLEGPALVDRTLDYLMASCDRPDDGEFQVYADETITSRGAWSSTYGYGLISAWKATIYALGFGDLQAADSEYYSVENPPFVLAADFELRGDLRIPVQQSLIINQDVSLYTVPTIANEYLPEYGNSVQLQELVINGAFENNGELNSSVTLNENSLAVLKSGSVTIISADQAFVMAAGSICRVESGAVLKIFGNAEISGDLIVEGTLITKSTLTALSGATIDLNDGGNIVLQADLVINDGAAFLLSPNTSVQVAGYDQGQSGFNPLEIEIICYGLMNSNGNNDAGVAFSALDPGFDWAGILLDGSQNGVNQFLYTSISDAQTALQVQGSSQFINFNLTLDEGLTGLKLLNRGQMDEIRKCVISHMNVGIDLLNSSPEIRDADLHHNQFGLNCTGSSPVVRWATLSQNQMAIRTLDSASIPNLGTRGDYGNNDFVGLYHLNNMHIGAVEPDRDIPAIGNWWGTPHLKMIRRKLVVLSSNGGQTNINIYPPLLAKPGLDGWKSDDGLEDAVKATALESQLRFMPVATNSSQGLGFKFSMPQENHAMLVVFDVSGRKVRELVNGVMAAGAHTVNWDGRDGSGRRSPSGIYLARLVSGPDAISTKCTLTH